MKTDTIASIATSLNDAGISIIRISGEQSISIINSIYKSKNNKTLLDYKANTIHFGYIYDKDVLMDEVMVSIFKAPYSFTTENTVEINCHGGVFITKKILDLILSLGIRLAEPGEFTKRAFLNGRIDLSKAEAIMDLIQAKNGYALKSSISQIQGKLEYKIRNIREQILYEIAFIESALDDPEHVSIDGYSEELLKKCFVLLEELNILINTFDNGKLLKEGINTVILGKPNAGKSSLLNKLIREDKAIVTNIEGTTRDVLEQSIKIEDIHLNLVDTAGIRDTENEIEKIGVELSKKYAMKADLILFLIDSSNLLNENDLEIINLIKNKKVIIVLNKCDLEQVIKKEDIDKIIDHTIDYEVIQISTKEDRGIELLEKTIHTMFIQGAINFNDEIIITNVRHKNEIQCAISSIEQVKQGIEHSMPEDFLTIDLMNAYMSLGYIIGEEMEEDLVNEIFSKFCTGK
ncbi:MAG: tRNA uridine-5-carboxymethylaminomethyl(34) synthesis GTPase MnmE [Lachnospiraceae bacterium]